MTATTVSCIVAVKDGERFLADAIESILTQTHSALETIVVDDGSTDRSSEIAGYYAPNVLCLRQENSGHGVARNNGISRASGAFLAFLDADDLWHPEKLERQLRCFETQPELDLCFCRLRNFLDGEDPRAELAPTEDVPGYSSVAMLARSRLFESVGLFDPALAHGEDRDWFLRAADHGASIAMLDDVLVYRRLHATNRSLNEAMASRSEYLRIVKASLDRRRELDPGSPPRPYEFGGPDAGVE